MTTNQTNSPLFALDIGTRSVVGLLLQQEEDTFSLLESYTKEHDERAMLDGQIHDVPSVAKVIEIIKQKLEEKHGPLKKVCVAAAGRSLKTIRAKVSINIDAKPMLTRDDLLHLELSAVQQAQYELANERTDSSTDYYCVGYSVLAYLLDDEPIGSLMDQTGTEASVEVIATFLPKVVVESLLAALSRTNLELEALTLEPIAAINVLIPHSMRRLNVALVDIGAGTSDIALTEENTVTAYGMVPVAGDEITEAISDHFLLDFPDAERVKRELSTEDAVTITDILGMETVLNRDEVVSPIDDAIRQLAQSISDEILRLNGRSPKAVMLVGGGSLTPKLPEYIASILGLPANRVAIRGADAIKQLQKNDQQTYGPDLVTPIGIAIAAKENPIEYISVTINDRTLRLFDVKTLTVGDGLLAAGIDIAKLYGKPGLAKMVTIQGRLISIPGEHGTPPRILKNGESASLDDSLKPNDCLTVERGQDGKEATITIAELVGEDPTVVVHLNGEKQELLAKIKQNGQFASLAASVNDRDHIVIEQVTTVQELLEQFGHSLQAFHPFEIELDGKKMSFTNHIPTITVNGKTATLQSILQQYDKVHVDYPTNESSIYTVQTMITLHQLDAMQQITVSFNQNQVQLAKPLLSFIRNGQKLSLDDVLENGDTLKTALQQTEPFILQDIFSVVNIELSSLSGKSFSILLNNEKASFTSEIKHGDHIEIK
ncbi:cell division protein FtsA [Halalkalibacter sp. APA_J-10(15)]|uniref:cell division protein FtsA n=1 Tax=unclassified Halalkalibacter TaxID=2893063 RepID=UPI001FF15655|nr:cell division protein FtsA [Halalkalibacter sp. APA_J-10(15)]MCK0471288.1 cell division protein FtsA [Halalkalibacter sp. APA_J-10(15)]